MKKFILLLFSSIVFLTLILSILTIYIDRGLQKTGFDNFQQWNDIMAKKIQPDLIIQGSSRAKVQYSTAILDSVCHLNTYNMGMDGSPFDVQYARFRACINNGIIPKTIIQNVDYETITTNTPTYQSFFFLPYLQNKAFKKQIEREKLLPGYKISIPFLKYSGELKIAMIGLSETFNFHHFVSDRYKGYKSNDAPWIAPDFKHHTKAAFTPDRNVEIIFESFLEECKSLNIHLIMVYSPAYCKLNEYIDKEDIIKYFTHYSQQYNIPFLNYSDDSISLDTLNYYNVTHLNKRGAEKFSLQLAQDIDSLCRP